MAMTARERIMAAKAQIAQSRSKGLRTYKWPAGTTLFRILPMSAQPGEPFERKFGKTYLKSFDGKQFFSIVDRSITYDEPSDPIRELIFDAMRQAPDDDIKDHYRKMLAGTRYVFNALILNDSNQKADEPVLIEVSETAFDSIMSQFLIWSEEDPDYDLAGLKTGHVFSCEKTGSGMDTRYTFLATPKKAPLDAKILEKVIDIDAWIKSQEEGLSQKALAFLGQLNGAVGITTTTPTMLTAQNVTNTAATQTTAQKANVSEAAVTTMIEEEDEVVEAAYEPVVESVEEAVVEDVPFEPTNTAPAEEKAAAAGADDIDSILAELGLAS